MSSLRNITCDNCSQSYPIDFTRLKRERNRITCRRCQHKIVFYKSKYEEPLNEQAAVDHADEKTLVEEERRPIPNRAKQFDADPPTAVSSSVPPAVDQKETTDPTIRRDTPIYTKPPVKSTSTPVKSTSPYAAIEDSLKQDKVPSSSDASVSTSRSDTLGLRAGLQLCAGMMVLGLLALAGMHFASGTVADLSFILGSSALTLGALWLVTGDFGFGRSNLGVSIGGASVVAITTGALTFSSASDQSENNGGNDPIVEVSAEDIFTPPPVESKPEDVDVDTKEVKTTTKRVTSTNRSSSKSMGPSTATIKDQEASNKAREDMFAAANDYLSKKEDAMPSNDTPSDINRDDAPPPKMIEPEELMEDDSDIDLEGFDDLGLDDEEEKKGLFARKDKEDKPEPKPVAKASGDIKVDIPQNVLDIIIRNNADVKNCYKQERAETGTFPRSLDVTFTLQPTGKVNSAYISSGPYVGSKFEGCIRAAFKGMTFPSFDKNASPQTLKYNLKL